MALSLRAEFRFLFIELYYTSFPSPGSVFATGLYSFSFCGTGGRGVLLSGFANLIWNRGSLRGKLKISKKRRAGAGGTGE